MHKRSPNLSCFSPPKKGFAQNLTNCRLGDILGYFFRETSGHPVHKSFFVGSATPCASPPLWPSIFSDYSFWAYHPVNQDDRHLLAHAMASDFSVAWQLLSERTIGFLFQIKLHVLLFNKSFPCQRFEIMSSFHESDSTFLPWISGRRRTS
jgi:hypothetical protein